MSFNHKTVAKLQAEHQRQLEFLTNQINTTDESRERIRAARTRMIEGVPIHRALANLCDEVSKIARGVRFAVERNGKAQWIEGFQVISEIWAYFPGDEFAAMRLGYADYSVREGSGSKYAVYSRTIKNAKFNEGREQHFMAMADELPRAVANVKKAMRRYTTQEVARMRVEDFGLKVRSPAWTASTECGNAKREVIDHHAFFAELRVMVERGYQFNDPSFGTAVKDYIVKMQEAIDKNNQQHHGYYVQVREYMGEQVFDVITVLDIKKATANAVGSHTTYKAEELDTVDENLASRMAALSMLDNGTFVEGLGHKVSPTSYWVLK